MTEDRHDCEIRPYRVLATCGAFEPGFRGGGVVRGVTQTVQTVSKHVDLTLVTRDRDLGSSDPYPGLSGRWIRQNRARVFYLEIGKPWNWWRLWRELRDVPFDLLYVNSLWEPAFTMIPVVAGRLGLIRTRKVLLAPHGELSPGALSLKAAKKRLFLKWWAPFLKSMDVVWQAHTDREAAEIRAVCPWAHIEVNGYQTTLPETPTPPRTANEGPARLVFIGRISPKKNLDLVLSTLLRLSAPMAFNIYGPLEDARYWSRCQSLISRMPSAVRVEYKGELAPADVRDTFAKYDAFAFPTLGENFGYVIAESLSASCPVICSDETPWTEILKAGGGRVIRDLTTEGLGKELERIAAMTPTERMHARQVAGDAYRSWRNRAQNRNILDHARLASWSSHR
jgi:glycosyltransferase involved in cell wall biosynthesis